jgi:hypothetical protein
MECRVQNRKKSIHATLPDAPSEGPDLGIFDDAVRDLADFLNNWRLL